MAHLGEPERRRSQDADEWHASCPFWSLCNTISGAISLCGELTFCCEETCCLQVCCDTSTCGEVTGAEKCSDS